MLKQENEFWNTGEMQTPYGRGINIQISVDDALGLSERIGTFSVQLFAGLETSWYRIEQVERGVAEFLVQDPDGYLLKFSQLVGVRTPVQS